MFIILKGVLILKIIKVKDYNEMSKVAADIFADEIKNNSKIKLGLATGSTPIGMYENLIKKYKAGEVDFSNVTTFNLDEYYPISPDNNQSYIYFMKDNLFNHVNINLDNVNIPNGMAKDINQEGVAYDQRIENAGGIDIQLLGVGRNGHIAFNEPDELLVAGTHKTELDQDTINANARFFDSEEDVPRQALTMGVGSILKSKKIVILISGTSKNEAYKNLISGNITTKCPVTLLSLHRDVIVIADEDALNG